MVTRTTMFAFSQSLNCIILFLVVKSDVNANSPDYGQPEDWIEYPVMQEVGAKGHTAQKLNDFSTTKIIRRIRE